MNLFPIQTSTRIALALDGLWNFRTDPQDLGEREMWYDHNWDGSDLIPVPSAWNEVLNEHGLGDYLGKAWYQKTVFVAALQRESKKLWLRVGAANHHSKVWINGELAGTSDMGFMPFSLPVPKIDKPECTITICVDNRLSEYSFPQALDASKAPYNTTQYEKRHQFPSSRFDFFQYGGITRSVHLVSTPESYIDAFQILANANGTWSAKVKVEGPMSDYSEHGIRICIIDRMDREIAGTERHPVSSGEVVIEDHLSDAELWSPANPYLYTFRVELFNNFDDRIDEYLLKSGFRTITWDDKTLYLNGNPLFLTGFGRHEDYPIVGQGSFLPGFVKDAELLRWSNANSYRTSHYPYDEQQLMIADELGLLVIDEIPAVSLSLYETEDMKLDKLEQVHKNWLSALVERDQNHPSVICWSTVNEPNLWSEPDYVNDQSRAYFRKINTYARQLDPTRPIMAISFWGHGVDEPAFEACDIIGINRYYGWYTDPGDLDQAQRRLVDDLESLWANHKKPIMLTEFGADTIPGLHSTDHQLFTEEFQKALVLMYLQTAASFNYCCGSHIWNLTDFRTAQHHRRVFGNKKGIFNRERLPKSAAFAVKDFWSALQRVHDLHRLRSVSESNRSRNLHETNSR